MKRRVPGLLGNPEHTSGILHADAIPSARRTRLLGALAADGVHQCAQRRRRGRNHFHGIEIAQLGGVGIQHTDSKSCVATVARARLTYTSTSWP